MISLLTIIFMMTLIYIAVANRYGTYINILAVQGILLFGTAYFQLYELKHITIGNLIFILLETLIFKAILVPYFLKRVIQRNKAKLPANSTNFYSLLIISLVIIFTFILDYQLQEDQLQITYFTASISAIFTGLYLIMSQKNLIMHILGYLVLENGIFLLSLAVGSEMPMVVNTGILLDLFTSVLILGIFVNRIGDVFKSVEIQNLNELKD